MSAAAALARSLVPGGGHCCGLMMSEWTQLHMEEEDPCEESRVLPLLLRAETEDF